MREAPDAADRGQKLGVEELAAAAAEHLLDHAGRNHTRREQRALVPFNVRRVVGDERRARPVGVHYGSVDMRRGVAVPELLGEGYLKLNDAC